MNNIRFVLSSNNEYSLFHLYCELIPSFVIGSILRGKDPSVQIKHTNTIDDGNGKYYTNLQTDDEVYLADIDGWLRFSRKSLSDLSSGKSITKYKLKDLSERHPGWEITIPGTPQTFCPSLDASPRKYGIVIAYRRQPHGHDCARYLFIDGYFYCLDQFEITDISTKHPISVKEKKDDLLEAKVFAAGGSANYQEQLKESIIQEQLEVIRLQRKLIESMEAKIELLTKGQAK